MPAKDPVERSLIASAAALRKAAGLDREGRKAATAAARDGKFRRYYDQTNPSLPEAERIAAAYRLRDADMKLLSAKSVASRRRARQHKAAAVEAERELAELGGVA